MREGGFFRLWRSLDEAQTEAFDNFGNSPYTEANAMQDGGEEVGTRGG